MASSRARWHWRHRDRTSSTTPPGQAQKFSKRPEVNDTRTPHFQPSSHWWIALQGFRSRASITSLFLQCEHRLAYRRQLLRSVPPNKLAVTPLAIQGSHSCGVLFALFVSSSHAPVPDKAGRFLGTRTVPLQVVLTTPQEAKVHRGNSIARHCYHYQQKSANLIRLEGS